MASVDPGASAAIQSDPVTQPPAEREEEEVPVVAAVHDEGLPQA